VGPTCRVEIEGLQLGSEPKFGGLHKMVARLEVRLELFFLPGRLKKRNIGPFSHWFGDAPMTFFFPFLRPRKKEGEIKIIRCENKAPGK